MAKGKGRDVRPDWQTDFVQCELTKEMKVELAKFDVTGAASFAFLTGAIGDGLKFSASFDKSHDCVAVFLTETAAMDGKRKRCLSARASSLENALRALYYKHSVILEGDWGTARSDDDTGERWG
jgi:hypothetical protein